MTETDLTTAERHGRAMGTFVHVVVTATDAALADSLTEKALARIDGLEARWSRFLPDSDVSRCNEVRGLPVDVAPETRLLVRTAIEGWERSEGRFDPTVYDALLANGYTRSFELLDGDESDPDPDTVPEPAPGCAGIVVDDELGSVQLPAGVGFDPGGIGKGLAADIVAGELIGAGAAGALVSLGGDLRCLGTPPTPYGWCCEVVEPSVAEGRLGLVVFAEGGLATSTTRKRRWRHGAGEAHHVIDPRTGTPVEAEAHLATVLAGSAWWAEVVATQLMVSPPEEWDAIVGEAAALVIDRHGERRLVGAIGEFLR